MEQIRCDSSRSSMVDSFPLSHHGSSMVLSRGIRIMLAAYQSARVVNKVVKNGSNETSNDFQIRNMAISSVSIFDKNG